MWLFTVKYLDFFKNRILIQGLLIYIKKKRGDYYYSTLQYPFFLGGGGGKGNSWILYSQLTAI